MGQIGNSAKDQIIDWLRSKRNYQEGLELYVRYCKNQNYLRILTKGQRPDKLAWLLAKTSGLSIQDFQSKKYAKGTVKSVRKSTPQKVKISSPGKTAVDPDEKYPKDVRVIMHEFHALYRDRSILHDKLQKLGDTNQNEVIKKRKELVKTIKELSERLDELHAAREDYEKQGIEPDMAKLYGDSLGKSTEKAEMNADDLRKKRVNLQKSLSKDRNFLDYNQPKKGTKKEPMPNGPLRKKIEDRLKTKEAELAEIDQMLYKMNE